jgi:hypothetical protein
MGILVRNVPAGIVRLNHCLDWAGPNQHSWAIEFRKTRRNAMNKRRWERQPVEVPCTVIYAGGHASPARASIVNLSAGGLMLASEQGFIANERVLITLEDDYDSLLFDFAETMRGTVRWSQAANSGKQGGYHVGIALEAELPQKIFLTEQ